MQSSTSPGGPHGEMIYNVTSPTEEDYPRLFYLHPRNRSIDWPAVARIAEGSPETVEPLYVHTRGRRMDAVWLGVASPALSEDLRALVDRALPGDRIRYRPIGVNDRTYYIPIIPVLRDALDTARTQISYLPSGSIETIAHPVFDNAAITRGLFRIPQDPRIRSTEVLKDAYEHASLTGLHFWPSGPCAESFHVAGAG